MKLNLALTLLIFASLSTSTMAEIYQCKQVDGRSSFSNTPCPSQTVDGTTEVHTLWREMNSLIKESAEISSHMGPDYYSILSCNAKSDAFNLKLDQADKKLNSLSSVTHKKMYLAMKSLRECGSCRASAPTYCQRASTNLMAETKVLASSAR